MTLYLCEAIKYLYFLSALIFKVNPEAANGPVEISGDDSSSCTNGVAEKLKKTEKKLRAMEESYRSLLSRLEVTAAEVLRVLMCMIHVLVVHVECAVILLLCSLHVNLRDHVYPEHLHICTA